MTRTALAFAALALFAGPALADPCAGALPKRGTTFSGTIIHVIDGDSVCVAPPGGERDAQRWIEIRVEDFSAPERGEPGGADATRIARRILLNQQAACAAGRRSYDRVVATCTLRDGRTIGDAMRRAGAPEGGR
jgi:micrococcal nuclease